MCEVLGNRVSIGAELSFVAMVEVGHAHEQLRPGDLPVSTIFGWEVSAAKKGPSVRQTEAIERPTPVALDHLDRIHHQLVDLGAFFAVNFDTDEMLIHQIRDPGLFEGFTGHHVAPMAGRIPNRNEDGFILGAGGGECLRPPWSPVHGVIPVLVEVEGAFFAQEVRHACKVGIRPRGATKTVRSPFDLQEGQCRSRLGG